MDGRITASGNAKQSAGHRARLRRKLLDAGLHALHDYELLEYLLSLTIPRVDTKPLAKRCYTISAELGRCCPPVPTRCGARSSAMRRSPR
jgi:hypothetical protein